MKKHKLYISLEADDFDSFSQTLAQISKELELKYKEGKQEAYSTKIDWANSVGHIQVYDIKDPFMLDLNGKDIVTKRKAKWYE